MIRNFTTKALTAALLMIMLTACANSETQTSLPKDSENLSSDSIDVSIAATDENESDTQSTTYDDNTQTASDSDYDRKQRINKFASDAPVTVYETTLRNGGDEYNCAVYIYNLMSETNDIYKGDCAIEISDGGDVVDRTMLLVGYTLGQMGTEFSKSGTDEYFSTIELEGGNLLLSTREDGDITQATLYTVSGNDIVMIERYYDDPDDRPEKGASVRSFNLSRDYSADGDNIIFNINGETVTVSIDFTELTLKCEDGYEGIVYCE